MTVYHLSSTIATRDFTATSMGANYSYTSTETTSTTYSAATETRITTNTVTATAFNRYVALAQEQSADPITTTVFLYSTIQGPTVTQISVQYVTIGSTTFTDSLPVPTMIQMNEVTTSSNEMDGSALVQAALTALALALSENLGKASSALSKSFH